MRRTATRALCAATVAGCAGGAAAIAAEPDKGTVSNASPKVTWVGQLSEGSYFASRALLFANTGGDPGAAPCDQGCDTYTVTVADQKDLTVGADSPAEDTADPAQTVIRVKKPDGSYLTTFGETTKGKPLLVKFKNAPKGDYVVDVGDTYAQAHEYAGQAFLGAGAPANNGGPPPPPPSTQPIPGVEQGEGPKTPTGGGNAQNINIDIKPGKASARKLKKSRKLKVTVTVSRPVASLTGTLKKRKTTVGTAKRGQTTGTVKVVVKLSKKAARKIKKGSLGLTFVARDGQTIASKTVKVAVRK
jgi:hypothetical protein